MMADLTSLHESQAPELNQINAELDECYKQKQEINKRIASLKKRFADTRLPYSELKEKHKDLVQKRKAALQQIDTAVSDMTPPDDLPNFSTGKTGGKLAIDAVRMSKKLCKSLFMIKKHAGRWKGVAAAKKVARFLKSQGVYEDLVAFCGDETKALAYLSGE